MCKKDLSGLCRYLHDRSSRGLIVKIMKVSASDNLLYDNFSEVTNYITVVTALTITKIFCTGCYLYAEVFKVLVTVQSMMKMQSSFICFY